MKNQAVGRVVLVFFLVAVVVAGGAFWVLRGSGGKEGEVSDVGEEIGVTGEKVGNPLSQEEKKQYLARAKKILDYITTEAKRDDQFYAISIFCDSNGENCVQEQQTTNHPILMWARHQYIEATGGDPVELAQLEKDISDFTSYFRSSIGEQVNVPYLMTSQYGCHTFLQIREESRYLSESAKNDLYEVCERSIFSADVNSYYGKVYGLRGGISESELDQLLLKWLQPLEGVTAQEKVADYYVRQEEARGTLDVMTPVEAESYGCVGGRYPIVGEACDSYVINKPLDYVYDERYSYFLMNQLAKNKAQLQPNYYSNSAVQPSYELQAKAFALDSLMYYYTQMTNNEDALGKKCLIREGLLEYAAVASDSALKQALVRFSDAGNFLVAAEELVTNFDYLRSLFECGLADSRVDKDSFYKEVALALSLWQGSEYELDGLLAERYEDITVGTRVHIPVIANSIIAGVLARATYE